MADRAHCETCWVSVNVHTQPPADCGCVRCLDCSDCPCEPDDPQDDKDQR